MILDELLMNFSVECDRAKNYRRIGENDTENGVTSRFLCASVFCCLMQNARFGKGGAWTVRFLLDRAF